MKALLLLFVISVSALAAEETLYQRLGGKPALQSMVSDAVEKLAVDSRILENPELKHLSETLNRKKFKDALTQRICQQSGGPCKRKTLVLPGAPAHLSLRPMEWVYVVQDVNAVLDQHHTPVRERTELINLLLNAKAQSDSGQK